jgi:hypothetical protein
MLRCTRTIRRGNSQAAGISMYALCACWCARRCCVLVRFSSVACSAIDACRVAGMQLQPNMWSDDPYQKLSGDDLPAEQALNIINNALLRKLTNSTQSIATTYVAMPKVQFPAAIPLGAIGFQTLFVRLLPSPLLSYPLLSCNAIWLGVGWHGMVACADVDGAVCVLVRCRCRCSQACCCPSSSRSSRTRRRRCSFR